MDNPHDQPADVTPTPAETSPETHNNTQPVDNQLVMGILCYLGPLVLIPFLVGNKANPFLKFHLKQGFVLAGIELVIYVLSSMMFIWGLWGILNLINLGCVILSVVGIVYVVQQKMTPLPLIGNLTKHINI